MQLAKKLKVLDLNKTKCQTMFFLAQMILYLALSSISFIYWKTLFVTYLVSKRKVSPLPPRHPEYHLIMDWHPEYRETNKRKGAKWCIMPLVERMFLKLELQRILLKNRRLIKTVFFTFQIQASESSLL